MPTPLLTSLISSGECVLYLDFRAGDFLDRSTYGNDGVPTNVDWQGGGVRFNAANSVITVADSPELQTIEGTVLLLGEFMSQTTTERLIQKRDAGGQIYTWYLQAGNMLMYDGAGSQAVACNVVGSHCIATNFVSGVACEGFIDGLSVGAYGGVLTFTADNAPIYIGNHYLFNGVLHSPVEAALIINRQLTATEHAQLYGELANMTWPTKVKGRGQGKYGVELVTNGDMETGSPPTGWIAGNAATLTAQTATRPLAGNQVLRVAHGGTNNPYAFQGVLTPGGTYRVRGWARGDATFAPYVYCGGAIVWTGTLAATWQHFDVKVNSVSSNVLRLYCNANAAGYAEFDNISCREVLVDDTQFKTDWQAHAGETGFAAGQLENLPIWIGSGNWQISTDTIEGETCKVIECLANGALFFDANDVLGTIQQSPFQDAYGTWEFWLNKANASTSNIFFISDLAAAAGYVLTVTATEQVDLTEVGAASLMTSAANYFSHSTWHKIRITRRQSDGQFSVYMDDVLVVAATGANPVADNTTTTCERIFFDLDTGDMIAWSDRVGNHNFRKLHGVIAP